MEKFNRAERRRQTQRLKKNRKNYWGYGRWRDPSVHMDARTLGMVAQNPQVCSLPQCCGNPRRGRGGKEFGRTLAEVIQEVMMQEQLEEAMENNNDDGGDPS